MASRSAVSTLPSAVSAASAPAKRRLTRRRVVFLAAMLFVMLLAAITLPSAWQATDLREVYLPQLAAMTVHNPSDGRALALLGAREMEAGNAPAAASALDHAVADGEKTPAVWLGLAACKSALGDPQAVNYLRLGAQSGDAPEIAQAQARVAALGAGASPGAVAGAICPEGAQPLLDAYAGGSFLNGLISWWGRQHPNTSGYATRETWADQEPNNPQAQRLWGLALLENERPQEAAPVLAHAAALAPHSPDVRLALGALAEAEGQFGQAAMEYVACLRLRPQWLPALLGLGRSLLALQMPATAGEVFREATRVDPSSVEAWIGTGQAGVAGLKALGYTLDAYTHAVHLAPNRTDFYPYYAMALRQNGRWQEAEVLLRRRLAAVPQDALAHYLLGQILCTDAPTPANLAASLVETQAALALDPDSLLYQQQVAEILVRQGQALQAVPWLNHILAVDPNNVPALSALARADQSLGKTAAAQAAAAQAATLSLALDKAGTLKYESGMNPGNIELHQKLARAYGRSGQIDKARQEQQFADYLQMHPAMRGQGTVTLQSMVSAVLSPP